MDSLRYRPFLYLSFQFSLFSTNSSHICQLSIFFFTSLMVYLDCRVVKTFTTLGHIFGQFSFHKVQIGKHHQTMCEYLSSFHLQKLFLTSGKTKIPQGTRSVCDEIFITKKNYITLKCNKFSAGDGSVYVQVSQMLQRAFIDKKGMVAIEVLIQFFYKTD